MNRSVRMLEAYVNLLFFGVILDSFQSIHASPHITDACEQCGRLDTTLVFLLTCALIMAIEGLCFWIVKKISLSFLILLIMAVCLGVRLAKKNLKKTNFTEKRRGSIPVENTDQDPNMNSTV